MTKSGWLGIASNKTLIFNAHEFEHVRLAMAATALDREVIIVGAGVQGLIAAKTFLQCQPSLDLCILDLASNIGGVWKKESLYPELRTNNLRGTFEFNDFPLPDDLGVKHGEHLSGPAVNEYLCRYAKRHDLLKRCVLGTKVERCQRVEGRWKLLCSSTSDPSNQSTFTCRKLVTATGLTSSPAPLELSGKENFQKPIVNFASLSTNYEKLLDPSIEHATVIGSGKASFDAIYLLALNGKRITWVHRASGHGPAWMTHPRIRVGPLTLWLERVLLTRLIAFMSPCLWGSADGYGWARSLFHNTRIGRLIVQAFYNKVSYETLYQSGLLSDEKLKLLIPDEGASWCGASFSILNYPKNLNDFICSGQVQILRKDIEILDTPNVIRFSDGSPPVKTDALICTTGWSYTLPFEVEPYSLHSSLGIPSLHYTKAQISAWSSYESAADLEVLSRFPSLARGPRFDSKSLPALVDLPTDHVPSTIEKGNQATPWRLWRGIAPPGLAASPEQERNIVFLGMMMSIQVVPRSEMQALWAWAWMSGRISPRCSFRLSSTETDPSLLPQAAALLDPGLGGEKTEKQDLEIQQEYNDAFYDTALFNRGSKWRAPCGYGHSFPDYMYDGLPYFDLLLRDLGLRFWRKGRTMFGELFSTGYLPSDYRGIVEEWKMSIVSKEKP